MQLSVAAGAAAGWRCVQRGGRCCSRLAVRAAGRPVLQQAGGTPAELMPHAFSFAHALLASCSCFIWDGSWARASHATKHGQEPNISFGTLVAHRYVLPPLPDTPVSFCC